MRIVPNKSYETAKLIANKVDNKIFSILLVSFAIKLEKKFRNKSIPDGFPSLSQFNCGVG